MLDDSYYEILDDGRHEDDVIMLGHFGAEPGSLGELEQVPSIVQAIRNMPTSIDALPGSQNIVFPTERNRRMDAIGAV